MNYTISTIQTNLLTVCKFEQPQDPQFDTLSTNLTTGTSGIVINDGYIPYLNLQTIKDLGINYNDFQFNEWNSSTTYTVGNRIKFVYPTWLVGTTYAINQKVVLNGIGYKSLISSNLANSPATNFDKWQVENENYSIHDAILKTITTTSGVLVAGKSYRIDTLLGTDNFSNVGYVTAGVAFTATGTTPTTWTNSTVVYNLTDAANINKSPDTETTYWTEYNLFNAFLESRLKYSVTNVINKCVQNKNQILEQKRIYYGIGDGTNTIDNDTKICGLKFDFIKNQNIKVKLNKIGLYFAGAAGAITIYLYNQNTLITSQSCTVSTNNFTWFDLTGFELTTTYDGSWFLYYSRNGLTFEAVNNELFIPVNLSNFIKINPFEVAAGTDLKNVTGDNYVYNSSFIANLDYSIVPDLTEWITYNKNLFGEAIKMQFGLDIYKMFLENDNTRSNRTERNIDLATVKASIYTSDAETVNKQLNDTITQLREAIGKAKIDNINLPTKGNMFNYLTDL